MSSDTKEIKLELAFPYDINIIPTVNGGCIVNVGCARLSYSTPARMITDLRKYLADPPAYEKAFYECNKSRGGNALAEPERPSFVVGSGQTVARDPADHPDDRERREGDPDTQEQTEESPGL